MTLNQLYMCSRASRATLWAFLLVGFPLLLAVWVLGIWDWDLSIPLDSRGSDDIWQLALTKTLYETGWVLTNPYLGAPELAHWHHNSAAQTSALHSVLMLALTPFVQDAVRLQQVYYLINFPLICLTSFIACRLLGVARLPSLCAALLFAFTPLRFNEMFYAFIPNYFMIPLALVAVIWIVSGKFAALLEKIEGSGGLCKKTKNILRTREFLLGLLFVVLVTVSDGYYAFFTLLLLGFSVFTRILLGDWRRPLALLPAGVYILSLLAVSLSLQIPLNHFKKTHWNEFYPSGIEDPVLTKHPVEAEIYSTSLKLSIAPISQHRIERMGKFGKWVVATRDEAFIVKRGNAYVPFGTLGSLLFLMALVLITIPALRKGIAACTNGQLDTDLLRPGFRDALLSLSLFIFLCSIAGGLGTLVALIFPTIRAYDRFPLFLLFVLFIGFAWAFTLRIRSASGLGRGAWIGFLLLITAFALYDQIPRNSSSKGDEASKAKFVAERHFVGMIEDVLPPNAMVYQYPYSQYLRESKQYGWGSFSHIRLYLHSHGLRWSNGGAKNSPADDWNFRISQLPLDDLIAEVEAVGFSGFVIDRTVVHSDEYQRLRTFFAGRGYEMMEDAPSNLTFVRLRDPGFRLIYDNSYRKVDRVEVTDSAVLAKSDLPVLVNGEGLKRYAASQPSKAEFVIRNADHPDMFIDGSVYSRGSGESAVVPISDMTGQLRCEIDSNTATETIVLTLENLSQFNWKLGVGSYPIRIGVHLRQPDGKLVRFDDGFRVPTDAYIRSGMTSIIRLPSNSLALGAEIKGRGPLVAEFVLMQEGYAWFNNINCTVPLSRVN